jgi:predicted amidohydrolase
MGGTVRLATTSLATLEDVAPPFNLRHPRPTENLELGLSLLEAAGSAKADLACLPEGFTAAGLPAEVLPSVSEPLAGPAFDAVAAAAAAHSMYVVAGFYAYLDGRLQNVAVLIGRDGELVGTYAKMHPTQTEIACGVVAGSQVAVFDTDFGRLGLAICFDINWPDLWATLAKQHVDLVCWISAYEGGFPLQAYAWTHQYPIVTSVWPYHSRVIDITGKIIGSTSRWSRIAIHDLALDRRLFHIDGQAHHLLTLQAKYADQLHIESYTDEHLFLLASKDPSLSLDEVMAEFGLVDLPTYVARNTASQLGTLTATEALAHVDTSKRDRP